MRLLVAVVFLRMTGWPAAPFVPHSAVAAQRDRAGRLIVSHSWARGHSGGSRLGQIGCRWCWDGPPAGVSSGVVRFAKRPLGVDFAHGSTLRDGSVSALLTRGGTLTFRRPIRIPWTSLARDSSVVLGCATTALDHPAMEFGCRPDR